MNEILRGVNIGEGRVEGSAIGNVTCHDFERGIDAGSQEVRTPRHEPQPDAAFREKGNQTTADVAGSAGNEHSLVRHERDAFGRFRPDQVNLRG